MLSLGFSPQNFISGNPRKPLNVPFNFMQIYQIHYLPASLRGKSQGFFSALSLFWEKHEPLNLKKGNSFRIHCKKRFTAPSYFSIIDIFEISYLPHFSQRETTFLLRNW